MPAEGAPMRPYVEAAEDWLVEHMTELAAQSGGNVGPGPASIAATAAMQLAASRFLFDLGVREGDPDALKRASSLGNDSRQNLLAAYELAAREARARDDGGGELAERQAAFQRALAARSTE